ncbi:MAG: HNH endonuclease [Clostridium sp.]
MLSFKRFLSLFIVCTMLVAFVLPSYQVSAEELSEDLTEELDDYCPDDGEGTGIVEDEDGNLSSSICYVEPEYLDEIPAGAEVIPYDSSNDTIEPVIIEGGISPAVLPYLIPAALYVFKSAGKRYVVQTLKNSKKNLKIRNGQLAGKRHPVTDVKFSKNGFPQFPKYYTVKLPMNMIKQSDYMHFREANKRLALSLSDPRVAKHFTAAQKNQIRAGLNPKGFTWHHNEKTGQLDLVNSYLHAKTGHTGGRSIWGKLY